MGALVVLSKKLATADADGICASQTPGAAGNLTIDGALASGGVATLDTSRQVRITAAGNESGRIFTITGANDADAVISEAVAGPNATTADTNLSFKTVTRVAIDGAAAGAVTVGTNGVGHTPWQVIDRHLNPVNIAWAVAVSGTVNYTVQYTYDDVIANASLIAAEFSVSALASKTTALDGSLTTPFFAWRLKINSGTETATVSAIQAGARP